MSDQIVLSEVMDSVTELLDRSVGAEEYLIPSGADAATPLVDLNQLDFGQPSLRVAGNKRTAAKQVERNSSAAWTRRSAPARRREVTVAD